MEFCNLMVSFPKHNHVYIYIYVNVWMLVRMYVNICICMHVSMYMQGRRSKIKSGKANLKAFTVSLPKIEPSADIRTVM